MTERMDVLPVCVTLNSAQPPVLVVDGDLGVKLSGSLAVSALPERLIGAQFFPIALATLLAAASTLVAVQMVSESAGNRYQDYRALGVLAGTGGVLVSLRIALASPGSIAAFVVGTASASLCYVAVVPELADTARQAGAGRGVAACSLLWISGTLVVGGTAAGDPGHQMWGSIFGIGIASLGAIHLWNRPEENKTVYRAALGALVGSFLFPVLLTVAVGEEVTFVGYLVAVVLVGNLWWFQWLGVAQER